MAGLYLHIPFCARRCSYCDFYSTTRSALRDAYADALVREAGRRKTEIREPFQTVYFGGGTPSQLTVAQLERILNGLNRHLDLSQVTECTLEANPDDLRPEYLSALRQLGFNRLSVGVQSFNDAYLKFMNRRHTAAEAVQAIQRARGAGFSNLSVDLMYGLPKQTETDWNHTLLQAIDLRPEHLSAYHLSYEEGTVMYRYRNDAVSEETSLRLFHTLCNTLAEKGYEHYEISNFALPRRRSLHNSHYWQGIPYLGLGAGAHSYDGKNRRCWNPDNLEGYLNGSAGREEETLSDKDHYNELVMTRLRIIEGIDTSEIPESYRDGFLRRARIWLRQSLLEERNGRVRLTKKGIFVSDSIIRDLFE